MRYSLSDNELFCVCVCVEQETLLIPVRRSGTGSAQIGRISEPIIGIFGLFG